MKITAPKAERLDVVGIGSMVVDRLRRAARILGPEEKGTLQPLSGGRAYETAVGGVVLNHLGWAACLGLKTGIFGKQAPDADGEYLRSAMDRMGIVHDLVLDGSSTSSADIFVDDAGERAIYMMGGATSETSADHVRRHHEGFISRASRLTTEISMLPLEATLEALRIAHEVGISTVVDLDIPMSDAVATLGDERTFFEILHAADLIKPSKRAARELLGNPEGDALTLAKAVRARFASDVVVTDGASGCAIATKEFEGFVPAFPIKAVDTTGAGDAFLGGLLVGMQHQLDWKDIGRLANACGATCSETLGAFPSEPVSARARILELFEGPALNLGPLPREGDQEPSAFVAEAFSTFDVILEELHSVRGRLDAAALANAVDLIVTAERQGGRVHVTGVGKPEHVAHYAAALLSSTGTPATFLHGTEVLHGSAGQMVPGDVVIWVSNSGETDEMRWAIKTLKKLGARSLGITGNPRSSLARNSDVVLDAGIAREGGSLGLAPRASVTAEIVMVAVLAAALEKAHGFTRDDYGARHPSGSLGKLLQNGSS